MQNIEMGRAEPQPVEQRINCLGLMMKYAVVSGATENCIRNQSTCFFSHFSSTFTKKVRFKEYFIAPI